MRLYHFLGQKHGLEAIRNQRLKLAEIMQLNDPFEFLAPVFKTRSEREVVRRWKEDVSRRFGLICLSAVWHDPLLWGHYAEKHHGMALGFDVLARNKFTAVEYVQERPTLAELGAPNLEAMDEHSMKRVLHQKFAAWRYEAEYRAFAPLDERDPDTKLFFAAFAPDLRLRQVIVGHRTALTRQDISAALKHGGVGKVEVFMSRPAFQSFKVVRQREASMWQ